MQQVGRNDPCPCGSGRKYKKCCIDKRPRDRFVYIGQGDKFQGITLENGEVSAHLLSGEKVKAKVSSQAQYTGASGKEKVLYSVPDKVVFDVLLFLASDFDVFWAIDTNTKDVGEERVSVSCVLECYAQLIAPTRVEVLRRKHGNIVFRNCPKGEAERFGWSRLVKMITSQPKYSANLRIGVVTDHDMARHSHYNARELPIYGELYLPPNFTLMYARDDKMENVVNLLIKECDKDAETVLQQLKETGNATIEGATITLETILDLRKELIQ